jgi:putative tricarboxylic transport membrane protein
VDLVHGLGYGFAVALSPSNLGACVVGVFVGTLIGVLPGIGPVATMSLLLPVTYVLSPTASIIMLAGIYYGAMYGGSTTSILANIPGESTSVVTCLDGYQMARQGRAGPALGIAAFGSFIAGTLSVAGITLLAPPLAAAALRFGPPEIFAVLLLGFTLITQLSGGSKARTAAMALLGMLLGAVGIDPISGVARFTFGMIVLNDGVGLLPIIMGLFGVSEVLLNVGARLQPEVIRTTISGLLPTGADWRAAAAPIARGSALGFFLGILPGMGAIIPTFMSYALERRLARRPERFGRGAIEGVAGPEATNNAASGGALIPLLTLGVAPNVPMALLLGAFLIHGVQPGPLMITERPELFWGVVASMYVGNVLLLALNLPLIGLWVQLLRVPYGLLFPLILMFCVIGVWSEAGNPADLVVLVVFGVVGYLMKKLDFEPAPLVLAFVLGRMAEEALRQSLLISRGSPAILLARPLAATILGLAVAAVLLPVVVPRVRQRLRALPRD